MVVYGVRRGKVILSARTTDATLHLGKLLSERWGQGQSGGHRALAGGQILFESLLESVPEDPMEASRIALQAMTHALSDLFSDEGDVDV